MGGKKVWREMSRLQLQQNPKNIETGFGTATKYHYSARSILEGIVVAQIDEQRF
jgi:hypothetical protein